MYQDHFFPFRYSVFRKFYDLEERIPKIIIIKKGWNLKLNQKKLLSRHGWFILRKTPLGFGSHNLTRCFCHHPPSHVLCCVGLIRSLWIPTLAAGMQLEYTQAEQCTAVPLIYIRQEIKRKVKIVFSSLKQFGYCKKKEKKNLAFSGQ